MASLPPDYHTHTRLCRHAEGEPYAYWAAAQALNLPEMAVTDHAPNPFGVDPKHRMTMEDFPQYVDWIAEAQNHGRVLFGIEADYFPGCERFLSEWLAQYPFDLVLGGVHWIDVRNRNGKTPAIWDLGDCRPAWQAYFSSIITLARTRLYDVVAHLDLIKRNGETVPESELREWALPALDEIAAAGMAVEINTAGWHHPVGEPYPSLPLLSWAREREIPIVFGSDAHRPEEVGRNFAQAVQWAREAGYTEYVRYDRRVAGRHPLPALMTAQKL